MKKIFIIILLCVLLIPGKVFADDFNIYLFYGDGCPHCKAEEEFLNEYISKNNDIKLYSYEVWYSEENQNVFKEVQKIIERNATGVPYLVVGESAISGYSEGYSEENIINTIKYYKEHKFEDKVGIYLGIISKSEDIPSEISNTSKYENETFNIPLMGTKQAKEVSLGLSAIIIGLVDGFNPCAMWILIFLISMLIGMKNKKRMWILGITFLVSSALVYFLFMLSWLNLAEFLNSVVYIRAGISLIAIIFGTCNVLRFISTIGKDDGCEVVNSKNRKKIILKIQKIVKEKTFFLAIIGIIVLAASVNIIELLCSLGLPVMYTEILAINEVSSVSKILYTLLYILFFLLDDLIVFIIAMKTLEIKAISNKYGKYSHLIGGIIMLIIGTLMLFKPELLMFNF